MAQTTKITLFEMAEAVGNEAFAARGRVECWDRLHPNDPLPPDNRWVKEARVFETAHLTLALMALDEEASRKFVASLIAAKGDEAKQMIRMLTPRKPKLAEADAA